MSSRTNHYQLVHIQHIEHSRQTDYRKWNRLHWRIIYRMHSPAQFRDEINDTELCKSKFANENFDNIDSICAVIK